MDKRDRLSNGQRTVLVLNINKEPFTWQKKLSPFDWVTVAAHNLTECLKLISSNEIKIAIAIISTSYQQKIFNLIEKINNANNSIKWLAIFIDEKLTEEAITPQFTRYFIDYHHLPIDWNKLAHSLGHSYGMAKLVQFEDFQQVKKSKTTALIGDSDGLMQLKNDIEKIAKVDSSVLISGETGTGKDLSAKIIHDSSARKYGPFININCGALPESLIHSELFGHEKGAYTGAIDKYIGHIERAEKGTLFLDEIGDLPIELQVNLLHFLENQTIERLGASNSIHVDCRIIAATHVNLEAAIAEGRFREDLFHRLNILRLRVPSLREHQEDIELIANYLLKKHNIDNSKFSFSKSAIKIMKAYDWPGNVRELDNRIQRATVMSDSNKINEKDLGVSLKLKQTDNVRLIRQRADIDGETLLNAMRNNNHNISAAARQLKISRTTFYRLLKRCNIQLGTCK